VIVVKVNVGVVFFIFLRTRDQICIEDIISRAFSAALM
jgi:hypothetical protein